MENENEAKGTTTTINAASVSMANAREKYELAVQAMALLEAERRLLIGPDWNVNRTVGMIQKYLPIVAKYAAIIASGGGLTALVADPGAFKSLLEGIAGIFG